MDPTQRGTAASADPAVSTPHAERADSAVSTPHAERADPVALAAAPAPANRETLPVAPTSAPARRCANCEEPAPGKYCAACGQETRDPRVTFRALSADFLEDYFSLDSRLFRSLVPLLFKPGRLTVEYLSGRRQRFVRPLRLYLVSSVLFFLFLSVPGLMGGGSTRQPGAHGVEGLSQTPRAPADADAPVLGDGSTEAAPGFGPDAPPALEDVRAAVRAELGDESHSLARSILETVAMASGDSEMSLRYLTQEIRRLAPRAVFAMLPVFALLLTILYRRSGRYYVEHFVFALHLHAFVFLLLTATLFSPIPSTGRFLFLWAVVYIFLALRRVYGGSILKTGFKYVFLLGTYFVLQSAVLSGIIVTLIVRG